MLWKRENVALLVTTTGKRFAVFAKTWVQWGTKFIAHTAAISNDWCAHMLCITSMLRNSSIHFVNSYVHICIYQMLFEALITIQCMQLHLQTHAHQSEHELLAVTAIWSANPCRPLSDKVSRHNITLTQFDTSAIVTLVTTPQGPMIAGMSHGITSKCWLCMRVSRTLLHRCTHKRS